MNAFQTIFQRSRFERDSTAPRYLRVKKLVQDAVASGDLKEGDAIPGERDVAVLLDISRVTVRKAFTDLVAEGVLVQRRGSGTYVSGPARRIEQPLSRLTSFTQDMQLRGLKTDADWLERSTGLPTPEEAMKLSISPGEHVSRFHRLRRADGVPMAIELAVIPQHYLPDPASVRGSLYEALDARGVRPVRALAAPACNGTDRAGSQTPRSAGRQPGTVHRAHFLFARWPHYRIHPLPLSRRQL